MNNNKLLRRYNKNKFKRINNNALLKNNIIDENKINEIKMMQNMTIVNKLQNKDYIRDSLINPVNIIKKNNINKNNNNLEDTEKFFKNQLEDAWKSRTNAPYKNILKNEDYNKKINSKEDLIVHKVTENDKIGVEKELENYITEVSKHNSELKNIYSLDEKDSHLKKFEYNHKFKHRIKHVTSSHSKLKQNISQEKKEEEIIQKENKTKINNILSTLKSKGLI